VRKTGTLEEKEGLVIKRLVGYRRTGGQEREKGRPDKKGSEKESGNVLSKK
jgi:hypothetical protein